MKTSKTNVKLLVQMALLVAIVLVMAYTPLGYLPVGPLQLSLLSIPVAIGAMALGPACGALLGGVFGVTSFLNAMQGKSAMGAAMMAASPLGCVVVCIVARVLMGLGCGLIFQLLKKLLPKQGKFRCFAAGLSAPVLNTVFFMGFLVLLFYNTDYVQNMVQSLGVANPFAFILAVVGFQGVVEAIVGCIVSGAVTYPLLKYLNRESV